MTTEQCQRCGRRVPWISWVGNLSLTCYKIAVGLLGGSAALVADGFHSLTDVIGTSAIIVSMKVSERPADREHQYGYGKAEFISSAFIYIVLFLLAIGIISGSLAVIIRGDLKTPRFVTMLAAGISVLYNVLMFALGQCAGKKNNSPALLANSFENRADAISSAACILGIGLAVVVHPICDPLAALVVGFVILVNSVMQLKEAISGLMDVALPAQVVKRIGVVALKLPGVVGVDYVRTRQVGTRYWVDLGIRVGADLDVQKGNAIGETVRSELLSRSNKFERVQVFVAAETARPWSWRNSLLGGEIESTGATEAG